MTVPGAQALACAPIASNDPRTCTMGFVLRDGLHYAIAEDRVLFLDIVGDRYFRLPEALDLTFRMLIADGGPAIAPDLIGSLVDRGVIVRTETAAPPRGKVINAATRSFAELPPATAIGVAAAMVEQMRAAALLRRDPLHLVLGRLAWRKESLVRARPLPSQAKLVRILSAHARPGAIDIDLPGGIRLSVDSYVNEKALARVLRAFRDVS